MMRMNVHLFLIMVAMTLLFGGCSTRNVPGTMRATLPGETATADPELQRLKEQLYSQYERWKGVRYREGGMNRSGIDCSGFVSMTYRSKFGLKVPRTTEQLAEIGVPVEKSDIRVGDLLFFKVGFFSRHVGIYLGKRHFLHASESMGVTISRLDNVYWKERYWKARRVL